MWLQHCVLVIKSSGFDSGCSLSDVNLADISYICLCHQNSIVWYWPKAVGVCVVGRSGVILILRRRLSAVTVFIGLMGYGRGRCAFTDFSEEHHLEYGTIYFLLIFTNILNGKCILFCRHQM